MLTKNEITALSLSPTKKDFVQIWNELLEVAGKLSERWDPTSTNESDPGIVLLKALTGIADKLNYNIDKNTLEAFMPTAAQEDSMRKLCDMLGYNMKYYRSAEVKVNIKYKNPEPSAEESAIMSSGLYIPKFTAITNSDGDVNYFITGAGGTDGSHRILASQPVISNVQCMEGQIVKCESNTDSNVITVNHISENNRFYLPETQIAENGIFIYNTTIDTLGNLIDGEEWKAVTNLNTQARGSKVYKFGFDSYESRPYIEFPEDYSKLFSDGLFIYYARTSGINGNISAGTLTQLELPTGGSWSNISADSFTVENIFAATSGANAETIKQAYNNFKKTIGTFETLVTCRDYMNKIYSFMEDGKPIVSNVLVTDIRNDINRAVTICSCDDAGIFYKETPVTETVVRKLKKAGSSESVEVEDAKARIGHFDIVLYPYKSYNQVKTGTSNISAAYDNSFRYTNSQVALSKRLDSEDIKTISHNFIAPEPGDKDNKKIGDVLSINNYLRLSAIIATNSKVSEDEGALIKDNIKMALANAFNMHELDFGDEIPFESLVEVIENADPRIKMASLNEPALYTTFSVLEGIHNNTPVIQEYAVASEWLPENIASSLKRLTKTVENSDGKKEVQSTYDVPTAKAIFNKLAVRNILAGRLPLFNYNDTFKTNFNEGAYQVTEILTEGKPNIPELAEPTTEKPVTIFAYNDAVYTGQLSQEPDENGNYAPIYTKTSNVYTDNFITAAGNPTEPSVRNRITDIQAECKLFADDEGLITDVTLAEGEFVKFRAPNLITTKTYPAYVNYYLELDKTSSAEATPASAVSLATVLNHDIAKWSDEYAVNWEKALKYFKAAGNAEDDKPYVKTFSMVQTISPYKPADKTGGTKDGDSFKVNLGDSADFDSVSIAEIIAKSGCIKLQNTKAYVNWVDENKTTAETLPEISIDEPSQINPYITSDMSALALIQERVDTYLAYKRDTLPQSGAWTISFVFEYVPFEARSLKVWEKFIKDCADNFKVASFEYQILDVEAANFKPVFENNTVLWRMFGEGYDYGKYITVDTSKLLKFTASHFGLLPENRLEGIYLVKDLGTDASPAAIKNNEEYELGEGERLFIEYTPSTAGTDTDKVEPVKEVYGKGTIIRPSGFEVGLQDSSSAASSVKDVTFEIPNAGTELRKMQHFGASEQVEIREFAKVVLSKDKFPIIKVYKNFNGCPELENVNGNNGSRKYTLKDGEAIFFTDQNEAEFAYYTSGTEVVLTGGLTIDENDIIELSTILDEGPQVIKWQQKTLGRSVFTMEDDSITFQEYQYRTLGANDTIKSLLVLNPSSTDSDTPRNYLNASWKYCSDVEYSTASEPDKSVFLPAINLRSGREGSGWEVCSTFELDVSAGLAQTLRANDKIETSLNLTRVYDLGGADTADVISGPSVIKPEYSISGAEAKQMLFKTNLACQSCGNKINLEDVWYNPDNTDSFQLRVFAADDPVIVETMHDTVIPYSNTGAIIDLANWPGVSIATKEYSNLWSYVPLDDLIVESAHEGVYDNALRLAITLLPSTYGIFSIYLKYTDNAQESTANTWIEVVPGTKVDDISILNNPDAKIDFIEGSTELVHRIYLQPGLNCIRVNKTGHVFIKTSHDSQGSLQFDKLSLVNSKPIVYTEPDKQEITFNTNGLNLAQIGYFDASSPDSDEITAVAKELRREAYLKELVDGLDTVLADTEAVIDSNYTTYKKDLLPYIREIAVTEETVKTELDAIKAQRVPSSTNTQNLIVEYQKAAEALAAEEALLAALEGNSKVDSLEQKLIALLDEFGSVEADKQRILDELAQIIAASDGLLNKISDDDIINDFYAANKADREEAMVAIRDKAAQAVENNYLVQLAAISERLANIANASGKAELLDILNSLRSIVTSDMHNNLQAKANELENLTENELDSLKTDLVAAAYQEEPDYTQIMVLVTQLRDIVDTTNVEQLLQDILKALEQSNDTQLDILLKSEWFTTDASGKPIIKTGALSPALVSAELVNIANAVYDAAAQKKNGLVQQLIDTLKNSIDKDYANKLNTLLADMRYILNQLLAAASDIDDILESLDKVEFTKSSETSQVKLIIAQLNVAINERSDMLEELEAITADTDFDKLVCCDIAYDAIKQVWPERVKSQLTALNTAIKKCFNKAIAGQLAAFSSYQAELTGVSLNKTNLLKHVAQINTVEALFNRIKPLLSADAQQLADEALISRISLLLADSAALTNLATIRSTNEIINTLINDWRSAGSNQDIREKQALQLRLKEELAKAIAKDSQVLNVLANILCPNLTAFIAKFKTLATDDGSTAYSKLIDKLSEIEATLKRGSLSDISALTIPVDMHYALLATMSKANFKTNVLTFNTKMSTLMPDMVVQLVADSALLVRESDELQACCEDLKYEAKSAHTAEDAAALRAMSLPDSVRGFIDTFAGHLEDLAAYTVVATEHEGAFKTLLLEKQLLAAIRELDTNREFYYNAPMATSFAIELGDSSLLNPQTNYDVNNVNNCFVISKLDIDFLDTGIQIARSSKLS